jgi:hypothetical protein
VIATDKSETFWQHFDRLVGTPPKPEADEAFGQAFTQQIKDMGCAVVGAPIETLERDTYNRLRAEWKKLCRGDKKMEDKFSKVALLLEIAIQPLIDELRVRTRPAPKA